MGMIAYIETFRAGATQLRSRALGREWCLTGTPVEQAIEWASAGYLPAEAAPLIAQGITPALAVAGDDALVAERGIVGAIVAKLELEHPGATVLVEPEVEEPAA